MEGFGSSASGGNGSDSYAYGSNNSSSYSSQQHTSGGGNQSSSSRMVGFGSDGRSFQPQHGGGVSGSSSSFISQDVTTAVSSAVDSIGGMMRSFSGSNKEVRTPPDPYLTVFDYPCVTSDELMYPQRYSI